MPPATPALAAVQRAAFVIKGGRVYKKCRALARPAVLWWIRRWDVGPVVFPREGKASGFDVSRFQEHPSQIISSVDRIEAIFGAHHLIIDDLEKCKGGSPP